MNKTYLRGDMYYADLGRGIGSEQEGYRPVVIIQNNTGNKYSPTVIVAAISSKVDAKAKLPTHYLLKAESGLELPSLVLLEQLRTIDKKRLETYIGRLEEKHIRRIDHALAVSVGLIEEVPENLIMCLCPACANNFLWYRLLFFALFRIFEEGGMIFFREQFRTAPFLLTTPES